MRSIEASVGSAYENVKVSYEQNNFLCQSHAVTTILLYISFTIFQFSTHTSIYLLTPTTTTTNITHYFPNSYA